MVARTKFTPIGTELSPSVAFVQAAYALDVAGMLAQKKEDIEGMCNVGALYIQLAETMMGPGVPQDEEEDEVDHEALARKQGYFGFKPQIVPVEEDIQEVELEDDERIDATDTE